MCHWIMKKNESNICKFSKSTNYDLYENGATVIGDYQDTQVSDMDPEPLPLFTTDRCNRY